MSNSLCILSMQLIFLLSFVFLSNHLDASKQIPLYLVTPQTLPKIMNCGANPIKCKVKQVWMIMFFNSSDSRQRDTFQYLIPKFAKQIAYTKQAESSQQENNEKNAGYSGRFNYPKTAVIDCFSSGQLCSTISEQELPLVIINNPQTYQLIYYKGYVTLSGLISFVKTHEPKTSYLAGWYQRSSSKTISTQNFSEKKIQNTFKKIRQKIDQQLNKKLQDLTHIYAERDFSSNYGEQNSKQKQSEYKNQNSKQDESSIHVQNSQYSNFQNKVNIQMQNSALSSGQQTSRLEKQAYTSDSGQKVELETDKQDKKQKKKQKKSKKQKQKNQTGQYQSYINAVQSVSQFLLDIFRSLHLPSQIIQVISYVVYPIFYIIFGLICIAVNLG